MSGALVCPVRCAIYTRKSSDEGLEQEFNSLDAQFDACQAYVLSQKHEGWACVAERFDDGGFSGATLRRPALQRLLAQIDAGEVDIVVLYKIDRLTRSLRDFGMLMERFDAANCAFVSVTQALNTSTSTGRLMLNVLLSFAQFEREITGERIKDKIAASKKKGMWVGGIPPLGYRSRDKKLVIVEPEAERVRKLFDLFREHECLMTTKRLAHNLGLRSRPTTKYPQGPHFRRSGILWILTNPLYAGYMRHREKIYQGQHPPIVDADAWAEVQKLVTRYNEDHRRKPMSRVRWSWLSGKIVDEDGAPLSPRFGGARGTMYRYYMSAKRGPDGPLGSSKWRLRADLLELEVASAVAKHLGAPLNFHEPSERLTTWDEAGTATQGNSGDDNACLKKVLSLVRVVRVRQGILEIVLHPGTAAEASGGRASSATDGATIFAPFQMRRAAQEASVMVGQVAREVDQDLVRFVGRAYVWWRAVLSGESMTQIAKANGVSSQEVAIHLPSAFLAPDLVEAIIDGRQPVSLTTEALRAGTLPSDWEAQRRRFGAATSGAGARS